MATYSIKDRWTGKDLYVTEAGSLGEAVTKAVAQHADLRYADLSSADLSYADLSYADLRSADLRYADLRSADLSSANLRSADLRSADLRYADLRSADLSSANLRSADLRSADLSSANLRSADLRYADLSSANLRYADLRSADLRYADLSSAKNIADWLEPIRQDVFAVLDAAPNEVSGLATAIIEGRVDGSAYNGECACLLGTIANVRHCDLKDIGIEPDSDRPAEQWFTRIRPGLTPNNCEASAIALGWIREWQWDQRQKSETKP